ncbi:hypothetical protein [Nocardia sp. NPDC057227]|uniref:WXG100-like domain-containing protein n=1 Tax=Nocardia sp. NPDC057227 TaxID=3346056 RepID=UPI00363F3C78
MIELPGYLRWLEPVVGMEWPEGNEDEMWALAEDWRTAARELTAAIADIEAAKAAALKAYPHGDGVDDMRRGFDSMIEGDQSVAKLSELFGQVGDSAYGVGTEIEYAKLMYWSSLALLAGELAAAWLWPPTAPAVQAVAIGLTRIAVRILGQRVVQAIIRHVGKLAASKFAQFMLRHVAIDTVLGTVQELGVQQYQVDQGHRDNVNWEQVAVTAVSSAAGGAAAGPLGDRIGRRFGDNFLSAGLAGTGAGLAGATAGFGASVVTQFGIDWAQDGWDQAWQNASATPLDWRVFTAGASNGLASGLNKRAANQGWNHVRPDLFNRPSFGSRLDALFAPGGGSGGGPNGGGNEGGGDNQGGDQGGGDQGGDRGGGNQGGNQGGGNQGGGDQGNSGNNGRGGSGGEDGQGNDGRGGTRGNGDQGGTEGDDGQGGTEGNDGQGSDQGNDGQGGDQGNTGGNDGGNTGESGTGDQRAGDAEADGRGDDSTEGANDRESADTTRAGDTEGDVSPAGRDGNAESETRAGLADDSGSDNSGRSRGGEPEGVVAGSDPSRTADTGSQRIDGDTGSVATQETTTGAAGDSTRTGATDSGQNSPGSAATSTGGAVPATGTTGQPASSGGNTSSTPPQQGSNPPAGETRQSPVRPGGAPTDVRPATPADSARPESPRPSGSEPRAGTPESRTGDSRPQQPGRAGVTDAPRAADGRAGVQGTATGSTPPPRTGAVIDGSDSTRSTGAPEDARPRVTRPVAQEPVAGPRGPESGREGVAPARDSAAPGRDPQTGRDSAAPGRDQQSGRDSAAPGRDPQTGRDSAASGRDQQSGRDGAAPGRDQPNSAPGERPGTRPAPRDPSDPSGGPLREYPDATRRPPEDTGEIGNGADPARPDRSRPDRLPDSEPVGPEAALLAGPAAVAAAENGSRQQRSDSAPGVDRAEDGRRDDAPRDPDDTRDPAVRGLELIRDITGSEVIRLPDTDTGLAGRSRADIEDAAGAPLRRFPDHDAIRDALRYETGQDGTILRDAAGAPIPRPDGASALVVDDYAGADGSRIGAAAHVLTLRDGEVVVHDPATGTVHDFPPMIPRRGAGPVRIRAVLFDSDGIPVRMEDTPAQQHSVASDPPPANPSDVPEPAAGGDPPPPEDSGDAPPPSADAGGGTPPVEPPDAPPTPADGDDDGFGRDGDGGLQRWARFRAEQADMEARLEAARAQWLRDLAETAARYDLPPGIGDSEWTLRMRAEQAEWNARMRAELADWLWEMAGGRPDPAGVPGRESDPAGVPGREPDSVPISDDDTGPDPGPDTRPAADESTPTDRDAARTEYDELLARRNDLAREVEFWRAKRDDRIGRLLDVENPDHALGTREELAGTVLRLYDEAGFRRDEIGPTGEELPRQSRSQNSPEEVARRREALRKLIEAAERVIELSAELSRLDNRIAELERAGSLDRPPAAETAAELDRLARERAEELLRIKPRRGMRDDLARRLGVVDETGAVDEGALSPDRLDETLDDLRARDPDSAREVEALGDAARDVNASNNEVGRLQDTMAEVAGAYRRDIEAEGGRMLTPSVGFIDGERPRLVVYGPRDETGRPLADFDAALDDALRRDPTAARAMMRPETTVEYRRVTADRAGNWRIEQVPGPEIRRFRSPPNQGRPGLDVTLWRDVDGTLRAVDPTAPDRDRGGDGPRTPKAYRDRDLPEGVSGWAVNQVQAAVHDMFADAPIDPNTGLPREGVNEGLLPHIPGQGPSVDPRTPTYELPYADAVGHLMRVMLEVAKLSGFTWYADPNDPFRIHPGFLGHPWFRASPPEVQPMVRTWGPEQAADDGDVSDGWKQRQRAREEAWAEVQKWADEQYARFRADDSDVDRIAEHELERARHREEVEIPAEARAIVDAIDERLVRGDRGLDPLGDMDAQRQRLDDEIDQVARDLEPRFADSNPERVRDLVLELREQLLNGADPARLAEDVAGRLRREPPLTREEILRIKNHLMRDEHLVLDADTGQLVRRGLDAVADVAEAWQRLIDGNPLPADRLLLRDALAESDFLRTSDNLTWHEANAHVAGLDGLHWDAERPPLTEWREGVPFAPWSQATPPRGQEPDAPGLPPGGDDPALPPGAPRDPDATRPDDETRSPDVTRPDDHAPDTTRAEHPPADETRPNSPRRATEPVPQWPDATAPGYPRPTSADGAATRPARPQPDPAENRADPIAEETPDAPEPVADTGGGTPPPDPPDSAPPAPGDDGGPRREGETDAQWVARMRAEQAEFEARMEADRAQWLRDLADSIARDRTELGVGDDEWLLRRQAEQAEWNARMHAERADWLRDMAGGRPDDGDTPPATDPTGPETPPDSTPLSDGARPPGDEPDATPSSADPDRTRPANAADPADPLGEPDTTPGEPRDPADRTAEYDDLLADRTDLARELEFWRAKRDDRIGRLLDIDDPERALGTREELSRTILRLYEEAGFRRSEIGPMGEDTVRDVRTRNSAEEVASRREALRKLVEAAERVIGLRERLADVDRRIAELERSGSLDRPPAAEAVAELDRLARERAEELLRIKPRRGMRDDLARRLGVPDEEALGPDRLDETLDDLRRRDPDAGREIEALGDAARDVNDAHTRIGRLQDRMAEVAGAYRRDIEAEGGRMLTPSVGFIDGERPRLVVYGPRDETGRPLADFDAALHDALRRDPTAARAITRQGTTVEYRRVTADREGNRRVEQAAPPELRRFRRPAGRGLPGLDVTMWRDADGVWHSVDPTAPERYRGGDPATVPKSFRERDLPEGVSGWGMNPIQASVQDVFVDPPVDPATGQPQEGFNKDLLPHIPGQSNPSVDPGIPTYELPYADAAYHIVRIILETAKLSGFTWYNDPDQPYRIHPGFKGHPWFRASPPDVQPMVRNWGPEQAADDGGDLSDQWKQRQRAREEAWDQVQRWADEQYERFRADDGDIDRIAATLDERRAAERAQALDEAQRIIDTVADRLIRGDRGIDPRADFDAQLRRLHDEMDRVAREVADRFADADPERVRDVVDDIREQLLDGADPGRMAAELAELLRRDTPEFTEAELRRIKDHLMRDEHLVLDPDTLRLERRRLDAVADVAEAWRRLVDGDPLPADILLLRDALAEADYLRSFRDRDDPNVTWHEANAHVAGLDGLHWDAERPPLTEWREGIPYAPWTQQAPPPGREALPGGGDPALPPGSTDGPTRPDDTRADETRTEGDDPDPATAALRLELAALDEAFRRNQEAADAAHRELLDRLDRAHRELNERFDELLAGTTDPASDPDTAVQRELDRLDETMRRTAEDAERRHDELMRYLENLRRELAGETDRTPADDALDRELERLDEAFRRNSEAAAREHRRLLDHLEALRQELFGPDEPGDPDPNPDEPRNSGGAIRPDDDFDALNWADDAYETFRGDDSDIDLIAETLAGLDDPAGAPLTRDEIAQIKDHLFRTAHPIEDYDRRVERRRFDADPDIAEAWIRLRNGNPLPEDLVLLRHELTESRIMRAEPELTYQQAHQRANDRHNWQANIPPRTGESYETGRTDGTADLLRPDPGGDDRGGVPLRPGAGPAEQHPDHRQDGQQRPDRHSGGRALPDHGGADPAPGPQRGELAGEGRDRLVAAWPEADPDIRRSPPPDPDSSALREVLAATETGRSALGVLDAAGIPLRVDDPAAGQVEQAAALVETAARVESRDGGRRALAEAVGRRAQLLRELGDLGVDTGTTRDPVERAVSEMLDRTFLDARDAAAAELLRTNPDSDPALLREQADAAGVEALLAAPLLAEAPDAAPIRPTEPSPAPSAEHSLTPSADSSPAPNAERSPTPSADSSPAPNAERGPAPSAERGPIPSADPGPAVDGALNEIRDALRQSRGGEWAALVLADNDVRLRFGDDPETALTRGADGGRTVRGPAAGYDPGTNTVRLPTDGSLRDHLAELVRTAAALEQRGAGAPERLTLTRDEYVDTMLDRQAEAEALAIAHARAWDRPGTDALTRTYLAAGDRGAETARRLLRDAGPIPADLVDAAAHRAGVRAVRAALDTAGPLRNGRTPSEVHGAAWDRAHGIADGTRDPRRTTPAQTPAARERRATDMAGEIEVLRLLRESGRFIPLGPAESTYRAAYDRAHRGAVRADPTGSTAEQTARRAGIDALSRYLKRTGMENAELAFDVTRAAADGGTGRQWGDPRPAPVRPEPDSTPAPDRERAADRARTVTERDLRRTADRPPFGRDAAAGIPDQPGLLPGRDDAAEQPGDGDILHEGDLPEGGTPLYRGIPRLLADGSENPAYREGLRGRAVPRGTADLSADDHIRQFHGEDSDTTSWARRIDAAKHFAGPDGLVLEWRTGAPPEGATWKFKPIYDMPDEFSQVLIQGTIPEARAVRHLPAPERPELMPGSDPSRDAPEPPRDADETPSLPDDDWSGLEPREVGERLAEILGLDPDRVFGFDRPDLDPAVAREFARGIADTFADHPHARPDSVGIGDVPADVRGRRPIAVAQPRTDRATGVVRTESITLNGDLASDAARFRAQLAEGVDRGNYHPSVLERPVYATAVHEYGHAVDYASGRALRPVLEDLLIQRYMNTPGATVGGYERWVRQLTGYSFDEHGELNPGEAIAEAFQDVRLHGANASEPARIINEALLYLSELPADPPPDPTGLDDPGLLEGDLRPPDDEWSRMGLAEIGETLRARHGFDEVTGFADTDPSLPPLDPELVRDYARAIDTMLARYPMVDIRALHIAPITRPDGRVVFGEAQWQVHPDDIYRYYTESITLNESMLRDPARFEAMKQRAERFGTAPRNVAQRPAYAVALHEFGHALDSAGGMRARGQAEDLLLEYYAETHPEVDPLAYEVWLGDLSGYSFRLGDLNSPEALAEAFLDVELNGERASEPARVLHALLVREAIDSRYDTFDPGSVEPQRGERRPGVDSDAMPDEPVVEGEIPPLPEDVREIVARVDGTDVPLRVVPDGDDGWRALPPEAEAERLPSAAPDERGALRRELDQLRDRLAGGYQGDKSKPVSGSGFDSKGTAAAVDGVASIPELIDPAPQAPVTPAPDPNQPVLGLAPDGGDSSMPLVRVFKEGALVWLNREQLPVLGRFSARQPDAASEHVPLLDGGGEEYRPWLADADPDLAREIITDQLNARRTTPGQAAADLRALLPGATPEQRARVLDDLVRHGLLDAADAAALDRDPPPPPAELPAPRPDGDTLRETAERLGFDLPDEEPGTVRRVLDEEEYRTVRAAAAAEGLADALRRYREEVTRPYRATDLPIDPDPGDRQRHPRYADRPDPAGRPVPFRDAVSFADSNPLTRFLRELVAAFGTHPGLLDYQTVGNGADPIAVWGDSDELGRDQGLEEFFKHALRRDQLLDELSTWAYLNDADITALRAAEPDRAAAVLDELRAAAAARAARLAEFAAAAAALLYPGGADPTPVGAELGPQAGLLPVAGGPDRVLLVDGPHDRARVLAALLDRDPALAAALRDGRVAPDFRTARTDWTGRVHLDPEPTPEFRRHRAEVDGRTLDVTLVRDPGGEWRPVQPLDAGAPAPPRTPQALLRDLVDAARELGIGPHDLTPESRRERLADLRLDNAVRAAQLEALGDFARSSYDIQTFHDLGTVRGKLADRLGLAEAAITPGLLVDALIEHPSRRALRAQQFEDIAAYAAQLRGIDPAGVDAARDRLAEHLGVAPAALHPPKYLADERGRLVLGSDESGLDPRKLHRVVRGLDRGSRALLREAFTGYLDTLLGIDPYLGVLRGDGTPDPRSADGTLPVHDPSAMSGLRDIIAGALRESGAADFAQRVGEAAARPHPGDPDSGRPQPGDDWAKLVGVDVPDEGDAQFRKVYEAYRDGKIDRHEGLDPQQLTAALERMRGEVRDRAARIDTLADLLEQFSRAAQGGIGTPDTAASGDPAPPGDSRPGPVEDARSEWKRRADAELADWSTRMRADLDEWVARMNGASTARGFDDIARDVAARLDAIARDTHVALDALQAENEAFFRDLAARVAEPEAPVDPRSEWKRGADEELAEWSARMRADGDEWVARMNADSAARGFDDLARDVDARFDAIARDTRAALDALQAENDAFFGEPAGRVTPSPAAQEPLGPEFDRLRRNVGDALDAIAAETNERLDALQRENDEFFADLARRTGTDTGHRAEPSTQRPDGDDPDGSAGTPVRPGGSDAGADGPVRPGDPDAGDGGAGSRVRPGDPDAGDDARTGGGAGSRVRPGSPDPGDGDAGADGGAGRRNRPDDPDRDGVPEGTGSAVRSHIPHPPKSYEFEFPEQIDIERQTWPVPPPTGEPQVPPPGDEHRPVPPAPVPRVPPGAEACPPGAPNAGRPPGAGDRPPGAGAPPTGAPIADPPVGIPTPPVAGPNPPAPDPYPPGDGDPNPFPPIDDAPCPPGGPGQFPPSGPGQLPPGGPGQFPPGGQGQFPPGGLGQFPPGGPGQFPPNGSGQFPPNGSGQLPPGAPGQFPPGGSGQFPPNGSGHFPPGGNGEHPPLAQNPGDGPDWPRYPDTPAPNGWGTQPAPAPPQPHPDSGNQGIPGIPPPMMPPPSPPTAGNGDRRRPPPHRDRTRTGPLMVRPYAGFGVPTEFDPQTGALRANGTATTSRSGVYAELAETLVVFYRGETGLALWLDHRTIDLEGPVAIDWHDLGGRTTALTVQPPDAPPIELRYRSIPPELDLGLLIRDVLADPERRHGVFR